MKIKTIVVGPVSTNCYVVSDGTDAVVVDPGADADRILQYIKKENLRIHYILLTHGHFDHILAVPELKRATGAPVVITAGDADCLMSPVRSLSNQLKEAQECIEPDIIAADGAMFIAGNTAFRYMLTPGHTVGSAVIVCGRSIFTGDTLFADDCGRTDLPGGSYAEILDSLRAIAALPGDYDIYPGHDIKTTLSREREHNLNLLEALEGVNSDEYDVEDTDFEDDDQ